MHTNIFFSLIIWTYCFPRIFLNPFDCLRPSTIVQTFQGRDFSWYTSTQCRLPAMLDHCQLRWWILYREKWSNLSNSNSPRSPLLKIRCNWEKLKNWNWNTHEHWYFENFVLKILVWKSKIWKLWTVIFCSVSVPTTTFPSCTEFTDFPFFLRRYKKKTELPNSKALTILAMKHAWTLPKTDFQLQ